MNRLTRHRGNTIVDTGMQSCSGTQNSGHSHFGSFNINNVNLPNRPLINHSALRPCGATRHPMGSALDEAERALVSGSWSKASDSATAARRVARTPCDRIASECVWVQAEYKLGRLGSTHTGDARRVSGTPGDPFELQTLLLWSCLKLVAAPRGKPGEDGTSGSNEVGDDDGDADAIKAEAAAADALACVFRDAARREGNSTENGNTSTSTSDTYEQTVSASAWLYAIDVLCDRRLDVEGAADWVRLNFATLPLTARERLVDVISEKRRLNLEREKGQRHFEELGVGQGMNDTNHEGNTDIPKGHLNGVATSDGREGNVNETATAETSGTDPLTRSSTASTTGQPSVSIWSDTVGVLNGGFICAVESTNETFGVQLDSNSPNVKIGFGVASAAVAAFAYAAVSETKRNPPKWLRNISRWI